MSGTASLSRRALLGGTGAMLLAGTSDGVRAAVEWPTKPVRIICAFPPGGLTDHYSRAYGAYIQQKSGFPVVVESKSGGGGTVATLALKAAAADGHTLMSTVSPTLLGNRILHKSLPYDPDKDFALVSLMSSGHLMMVAHKSTGATTIKEFVAYARANKVSFGSYAAGSFAHVVCAELNREFGLDMVVVNYRGEGQMWQDMLAGSIQAAVGSYQAASAALQTGAGRALAVNTTKRMRKEPGIPTFIEQGLPPRAFQLMGWACILALAGTPPDLVAKISDTLVEAGQSERVQKLLDTFGIDDAAVGHKEFRAIYDAEGPIWLDLVGQLKITAE